MHAIMGMVTVIRRDAGNVGDAGSDAAGDADALVDCACGARDDVNRRKSVAVYALTATT